MFPYWSAPPSLLRIWVCPEDAFPATDDRSRSSSPAAQAGDERGSRSRGIERYMRALLFSRAADPRVTSR